MSKSEDAERPVYQVLKPRTIVLISAMLVVTGVGIGAWLVLAYGQGDDHARLDAIKTAGSLVLVPAGLVAFWLAARCERVTLHSSG